MIKHLTPADSGRYACSRALNENYYASIFVHVLQITNGGEYAFYVFILSDLLEGTHFPKERTRTRVNV